jgi:hypothetical protein
MRLLAAGILLTLNHFAGGPAALACNRLPLARRLNKGPFTRGLQPMKSETDDGFRLPTFRRSKGESRTLQGAY